MTTFAEQLTVDMDAAFIDTDEFGVDVLYNAGSGPVAIEAIVDYGSDGAKPGDQASILVKKSDVSSPDYRHTFTIDGAVWYVRANEKGKDFILSQDDAAFLLAISKNERFSQWLT